jgi:hypothetical protein
LISAVAFAASLTLALSCSSVISDTGS